MLIEEERRSLGTEEERELGRGEGSSMAGKLETRSMISEKFGRLRGSSSQHSTIKDAQQEGANNGIGGLIF